MDSILATPLWNDAESKVSDFCDAANVKVYTSSTDVTI
jgi:hypothetical protein